MRKTLCAFVVVVALVCILGVVWAQASEIVDDLMASRRVFPSIWPGLRALRHGAIGNYYLLGPPAFG
ncbi:MAG: hypothetical protein WBW49_11400, partial [Candidatus Acidiferrum sp.]